MEDLAPLARLTRLDLLNLDGNQVRDVSVLAQLRRLCSVELSGNPLDLDQVEALRGQGMEATFFLPGISFQNAQLEQCSAQCGQEANRGIDGGGFARNHPSEAQQLGQVAGGH